MDKSKWIKWILGVPGALAALLILFLVFAYLATEKGMNRTYAVAGHSVVVGADSQAVARGRRLSIARGCTDCHGKNLAGRLMIDEPPVAKLYAANLTPGRGGIAAEYTDKDWERAIRHAVAPDGKPLLFMPAHEFFYLGDEDLAALIAYLKTVKPVDNELPANSIGFLGRILYVTGQFPLIPADMVDHAKGHPKAPRPGVTVDYGRYLSTSCMACHGADFAGGKMPGTPPDWPPAANLTPGGKLKEWSEYDFIRAIRTGIKPNGQPFTDYMPVESVNAMTDEELKAIWLFLNTLPVK